MELHHRFDGPAEGPVLVLSNALATTLHMWDEQIPDFARRYRVLRYDHPGHGRSPAAAAPYSIEHLGDQLLGLLDRHEIDRASFCGISLGGMVGMWLALHAPARIERLVLACTAVRFGSPDVWAQRATSVRTGGMDAVVGQVLERWLTERFRGERPALVDRLGDMLRATPAEVYAAYCEMLADLDLRTEIDAVRSPTLVIAGSEDPSSTPEDARLLKGAIAGARLVFLESAHLANVERPLEFADAVLQHLSIERKTS